MIDHRLQLAVILLGCSLTWAARADLPAELKVDGVSFRTLGLYRGGSGEFFHVEYSPAGQTPTTAAKSVEFFRQPLATDRLDQLIEVHLETSDRWTPKGVLTVVEKSEQHLVLKDVRFDGTLSGSPLFIISIYELRGRTLLSAHLRLRPVSPFDTPESFSKEFATKEARWLKELREVSRAVQEELAKEAKTVQRTGASRSAQETNRTSSAAGSRR